LVPRPMTIRVFAARKPDGSWTFMPGGYARIGKSGDTTALAMQAGGSVADVWVVGDRPPPDDTLTAAGAGPFRRRAPGLLPARAADNLYWLGRYMERAENAARLLRAYHVRLEDGGRAPAPLVAHVAEFLEELSLDPAEPAPEGLIALFESARACAGKIRDRFSTDGWNAINDVAETALDFATRIRAGDDAARAMGVLLRKLAGFSGLVHDNMFRFSGWRFLTIGRALERAHLTAAFLGAFTDPETPAGGFDLAVEVGDCVMTHRRRYSVATNRDTVIDLLALDGDNPRSILFQADVICREEALLLPPRRAPQMTDVARRLLQLRTALAVATPEEIDLARLEDMQAEIVAISDALTARYMG
ncbi:MAG: alpha-E domain-containing protein, partial [Pikeienuella sp.]